VKILKVTVPDEFVEALGSESAAQEEITRLTVIELVRQHTLGRGQAASLLKMDRIAFDDLLAKHQVPSFELLPGESMEQHLAAGAEVMKGLRGQ
jgi:predicted HTH domain antitoxin